MRNWTVECGGNKIAVVNSFTTLVLRVNGQPQDVYWGIFAPGTIRLRGSVMVGGQRLRVKVVVGSRLFSLQCAIFVADELVYCSTRM